MELHFRRQSTDILSKSICTDMASPAYFVSSTEIMKTNSSSLQDDQLSIASTPSCGSDNASRKSSLNDFQPTPRVSARNVGSPTITEVRMDSPTRPVGNCNSPLPHTGAQSKDEVKLLLSDRKLLTSWRPPSPKSPSKARCEASQPPASPSASRKGKEKKLRFENRDRRSSLSSSTSMESWSPPRTMSPCRVHPDPNDQLRQNVVVLSCQPAWSPPLQAASTPPPSKPPSNRLGKWWWDVKERIKEQEEEAKASWGVVHSRKYRNQAVIIRSDD